MSTRYDDLIAKIRKPGPTTVVPGTAHIMHNMAVFLAALADEAREQSEQNLKLQTKLLRLTWVLAVLTAALFVLTVFLTYDAYQKTLRGNEQPPHTAEQQ